MPAMGISLVGCTSLLSAWHPLLPPWRPTASGLAAHKTASDQREMCAQNSSLLEPGKQALLGSHLPTAGPHLRSPGCCSGPCPPSRELCRSQPSPGCGFPYGPFSGLQLFSRLDYVRPVGLSLQEAEGSLGGERELG